MRRRLPLCPLLVAALASGACKGKEVEVVCRPGALQFSRAASLVAEPAGVLADVRIAAVGSDFAIVWSAGASAADTDLYGRLVRHDGIASSNEVRITQAAGLSSRLRLAPGPSGIGVSWTDGRFTQQVAMATVLPPGSLSASGLPAVFQSPVVATDQAPIPGIAVSTSGWIVAWNGRGSDGNDHLFAQVLTSSGAAAGSPFPLAAAQEDRATRPTVAAAGSGGLVVIVDEEMRVGAADADVWATLVAGTGALASARYGASSEATSPEAVAFEGGAGVVWTDLRDGGRADLWYAQFGGGEIRLTQGPEAHGGASVVSAGAGFLLSWLADGELRFRAMKADGRPDGGPIAVGEASRGDVGWNGFSAGVVWIDPDSRIWFRPLACQ